MAADWSSMPPEIIRLFADKLIAIEDYTAVTAVCRSFRAATPRKEDWRCSDELSRRPPWLLLCDGDENPPNNERSILSMYKNKKFYMNLPEIYGRRCWGTPYGWIVTLGDDLKFHLFNPLNRRRIPLPDVTCDLTKLKPEINKSNWIRGIFRHRAILIKRPPCSSPGYDDFLVVAFDFMSLPTVMKPQTNTWHRLYRSGTDNPNVGYIFDIVPFNDKIYALGVSGRLMICSNMMDGPDPPTAEDYVPVDKDLFDGTETLYIVESMGELLLISRSVEYFTEENPRYPTELYGTDWFDVYKLNHQTKKWLPVEDLGDQAFFVGDCQTVVLSSPEDSNCRSNCIYFADDNYDGFGGGRRKIGHDMGVFDFEEGTIQHLYEGADSSSFYSTPTWFIPSFT